MGIVTAIQDSYRNLVANLNTSRDKAAGGEYYFERLTVEQLCASYRSAWLPRKIVDIPAMDATRRWRDWQASADQISSIEAEEKRLDLQGSLKRALIAARLYGGGAIYIGTTDSDLMLPFDPKTNIQYLTVLTKIQLINGDIDLDPLSPTFGRPKWYEISSTTGGIVRIHPTRLAIFIGSEVPEGSEHNTWDWGDSVLQSTLNSIKQADGTAANVASLVFENKVDVISIPNLMESLSDDDYTDKLNTRFTLAATAKGNNGMLILDDKEVYTQKSTSLTTLPDIIDRFFQQVSGAADIPMTRLFGMSPAGMNSTGESDLHNYYDRIQSIQELDLTPALALLDMSIVWSALNGHPKEVHYNWSPLWQLSDLDRAGIGEKLSSAAKSLEDAKLIPSDALGKAVSNSLIEMGVFPGLETALDEYDSESEPDVSELGLSDAQPRTLYVYRPLINHAEFTAWANSQGFNTTLGDDTHVTIAFSKTKVDWLRMGQSYDVDKDGKLTVSPGGPRIVETLGDEGAVVLMFGSSDLSWRNRSMRDAGASWDWPDYQPHITITYEPGDIDLSKVEPYRGELVFGPEVFEEINENAIKEITET